MRAIVSPVVRAAAAFVLLGALAPLGAQAQNSPPVYAGPFTFAVVEGTTLVANIVITDADAEDQAFLYQISSGIDANTFFITQSGPMGGGSLCLETDHRTLTIQLTWAIKLT